MRGPSAKVVLHREAIDALILGGIDGLTELAKATILDASGRAPDSPYEPYPTGEGLPKQGGVLAYAKGGKVGGWSIRGKQPPKPRTINARAGGFLVIGGFGFPAHFAEFGTIHEPARPFLTPALMANMPDAQAFIAQGVRKRIGSAPGRAVRNAAITARING